MILAIHGGGWRKQNKDDYGPRIALAFVPHGYARGRAELSLVLAGEPNLADKP